MICDAGNMGISAVTCYLFCQENRKGEILDFIEETMNNLSNGHDLIGNYNFVPENPNINLKIS
jgi:hypothetical protein